MNPIPNSQNLFALVTDRQTQVIQLLAEGQSTKEIAHHLGIAVYTVEKHRRNILKKTGCKNTAHIVATFLRARVIA